MKKLITICLLLATAFPVKAQTKKPTKDETIAYLDKVLKLSVGYNRYGGDKNDRRSEFRFTDYSFSYEKVVYSFKRTVIKNGETSFGSETYTKIPWDNLSETEESPEDADFHDDDLVTIIARFSTKLRYDAERQGNEVGMDEDMHYPKGLLFNVIKTKAESFKKALKRLAEIAKEENKDPFQN